MDWTVFHSLNGALRGVDGGLDAAVAFNATAIFVLIAATALFWFVERPRARSDPRSAPRLLPVTRRSGYSETFVLREFGYHPRPSSGKRCFSYGTVYRRLGFSMGQVPRAKMNCR